MSGERGWINEVYLISASTFMGMDLAMNRCSKSDNPRMKAKIIYAVQKLSETKTCFRMLEHDLMKGMTEVK